jgi:hypothetical protein
LSSPRLSSPAGSPPASASLAALSSPDGLEVSPTTVAVIVIIIVVTVMSEGHRSCDDGGGAVVASGSSLYPVAAVVPGRVGGVMFCNANMVMSLSTIQLTLMEQLNLICILMNQSQAD